MIILNVAGSQSHVLDEHVGRANMLHCVLMNQRKTRRMVKWNNHNFPQCCRPSMVSVFFCT